MIGAQLPLSVRLPDSASFENFVPHANAAAVSALRATTGDVLLIGAAGSGKSHLLQATLRERQAGGLSVAYVPLCEYGALLDGLEAPELLAIDELEALPPDGAVPLLRLIDARRSEGRCTVFASRERPGNLAALPPDLRTRLARAALFPLQSLDDAGRTELLTQRAAARGLRLPPEVARWLLTQLPRDSGSLVRTLDALDLASLQAQRRLTIPFVQQALRDVRPPTT